MRRAIGVAAMAGALILGTAPAALASDWTHENNPGVTVWEHGGSNLGECSAYLATVLGVRDDVNHLITNVLGTTPGSIYSNRARQAVNLDPVHECLQHQF